MGLRWFLDNIMGDYDNRPLEISMYPLHSDREVHHVVGDFLYQMSYSLKNVVSTSITVDRVNRFGGYRTHDLSRSHSLYGGGGHRSYRAGSRSRSSSYGSVTGYMPPPLPHHGAPYPTPIEAHQPDYIIRSRKGPLVSVVCISGDPIGMFRKGGYDRELRRHAYYLSKEYGTSGVIYTCYNTWLFIKFEPDGFIHNHRDVVQISYGRAQSHSMNVRYELMKCVHQCHHDRYYNEFYYRQRQMYY